MSCNSLFSRVILSLMVLLTMAPSALSQEQSAAGKEVELTVLITTDLYGRFSEMTCRGQPQYDFSHLIGAIDSVRKELSDAGKAPPLVLNGGDNIGPRAFARFLLTRGEEGGQLLASWMKRAGYELVALGNQDFYAVKRRLRSYLKAGKQQGLTFAAANLDCAKQEVGFCPYLGTGPERYVMLERSGLKIAVFSVIHGDLENDVKPGHLEGMVVADPIERAQDTIEAARAAGADLVIVLSHVEHSETSPRSTIKLARAIPDADLVVANAFTASIDQRGIGAIRFSDRSSPVVGCDLMGEHLCRADLVLEKSRDRWQLARLKSVELEPARAQPDPEVQEQIREVREDYCEKWNNPVGQGRLAAPMTAQDFELYMLEVMRNTTSSELAFINRGLVANNDVFPLQGQISRHDFFAGLPHRNTLYTFDINGKQLLTLCKKLDGEALKSGGSRLIPRGLTCGKKPKVNGRLVDKNDSYSAATIDYLAKGIGGYFKKAGLELTEFRFDDEGQAPVLGQLARRFLAGPQFSGPDAQPIDIENNFPDLSRSMRWIFLGGLDFNLSDTTISNKSEYDESQFSRDEFIALKGELRGLIEGDSKLHGLALEGRMKYARSSTAGGDWSESEDLSTINAIYKLKAWYDDNSSWYVPMPYVEGKMETELTRPEDDPATVDTDEGRDYHYLEITGTMGARFKIFSTMEAKIGAGVRHQVLDETADPVYGFDVGYKMKKTNLWSMLGSPVQMESELNAFFGDVGRSNTLKGSWTNRLYFLLIGPIYFNITHELFVYRYSDRGYGLASDLTFGLSYNAQTAVQTF